MFKVDHFLNQINENPRSFFLRGSHWFFSRCISKPSQEGTNLDLGPLKNKIKKLKILDSYIVCLI